MTLSQHMNALNGGTALPTWLPRIHRILAALERPTPIIEAARRHGGQP